MAEQQEFLVFEVEKQQTYDKGIAWQLCALNIAFIICDFCLNLKWKSRYDESMQQMEEKLQAIQITVS